MRARSAGHLCILAALLCTACIPETVIRRTALVPGVVAPAMTGHPLRPGEVKLSGGLNSVALAPEQVSLGLPTVGDPGLLVPAAQASGSAWVGVSEHVELGVHLSGAPLAWTQPSSGGVLGIPDDGSLTSLTGGFGARFLMHGAHSPVWGGLSAEFNLANAPQGVFVKCPNACASARNDGYVLDHTEGNLVLMPNVFAHFGGDLGRHFSAGLFGGLEPGLRNVGFEADGGALYDQSLSSYPIVVGGAGVEARFGKVRVETNVLLPISGDQSIWLGPAITARVGVVL
jgi:hypothetical protein